MIDMSNVTCVTKWMN